MIRLMLLSISLALFLPSSLHAAEEHPKAAPIIKGRIILVNGTSSSGKTTLCQQVAKGTAGSWSVVSLDDVPGKELSGGSASDDSASGDAISDHSSNAPSDDDEDSYLQNELMRLVKMRADTGENVICDTVLLGGGIYQTLKRLKEESYQAEAVLVYCPINESLKRVQTRNLRALSEGADEGDLRDCRRPFVPVLQFSELYKCIDCDHGLDSNSLVVDKLSHEDLTELRKQLSCPYPSMIGRQRSDGQLGPDEIERLVYCFQRDFNLKEQEECKAISPRASCYSYIAFSAQPDVVCDFVAHLQGAKALSPKI